MNTALRIASVTQVMKDLLVNGLIDHDLSGAMQENIVVTALPPDKVPMTPEASQLNLFMYCVTYNQGWNNAAYPSFNQAGARISNPPLALDLHYLLSAYGSAELHNEILLGYGMQLLHQTPSLNRDAIRKALAPPDISGLSSLPPSLQHLTASDLAEQAELIKITPEVLNIEDISKLWAAFGSKYRPTAAYKVTVVLIESTKSVKVGPPVKQSNIYVDTLRTPQIEHILSQKTPADSFVEGQKIFAGYRLELRGIQFNNATVSVQIDAVEIDPVATNLTVTNQSLSFDLPADIPAGSRLIQIVHPRKMGTPEADHTGVMSNAIAFELAPGLSAVPVVNNPQQAADTTMSADIALKVTPLVAPGQKVVLLLNELTPSATPKAYSFQLPTAQMQQLPAPTADLTIPISGVKKATYLLRLVIDDVASDLGSDLVTGTYNSPVIVL